MKALVIICLLSLLTCLAFHMHKLVVIAVCLKLCNPLFRGCSLLGTGLHNTWRCHIQSLQGDWLRDTWHHISFLSS